MPKKRKEAPMNSSVRRRDGKWSIAEGRKQDFGFEVVDRTVCRAQEDNYV
jgi:hypothetical protein